MSPENPHNVPRNLNSLNENELTEDEKERKLFSEAARRQSGKVDDIDKAHGMALAANDDMTDFAKHGRIGQEAYAELSQFESKALEDLSPEEEQKITELLDKEDDHSAIAREALSRARRKEVDYGEAYDRGRTQ